MTFARPTGVSRTRCLDSELDLAALGIRAYALTQLGRLGEARALLDRSRSLLRQASGKLSPFWTDTAERAWLVATGRAGEALSGFQAAWLALAEARGALGDPRAGDAQEQAHRIQTESTAHPLTYSRVRKVGDKV